MSYATTTTTQAPQHPIAWEIEVLELPLLTAAGLRGMLVVLHPDGRARFGEPVAVGQPLADAVCAAVDLPIPPAPVARPTTLICRPQLADELASAAQALGAALETRDRLPNAERLHDVMGQTMVHHAAMLPIHERAWRHTGRALWKQAPWREVPERVQFRFPRGDDALCDAVAIVVGEDRSAAGVLVFPTEADFHMHLTGRDDGRLRCWMAGLTPLRSVDPDHRRVARAQALCFGPRFLELQGLDGPHVCSFDTDTEHVLLMAVRGVLGACRAHGAALAVQPHTTPVDAGDTELVVASLPVWPTPSAMAPRVHQR